MTHDPAAILNDRFLAAMRAALGDTLPAGAEPMIAPSRNPAFGDYQVNCAMALGKQLGKPPREIAQAMLAHLRIDDIAEPPTIAGPGFINVTLRADALAAAVAALDRPGADGDLGIDPVQPKSTVVVDLCGVNLAKQMHVGHLRATVIGDCLARLHERLGYNVIRQNHFGDWGLPIAMVTGAVLAKTKGGRLNLASLTLDDLEREYRAAQRACDAGRKELMLAQKYGLGPKTEAEWAPTAEDAETASAAARAALVALQSGETETFNVWQRISEITLEACFANCARLQAHVTDEATAGESTYRDELAPVVADLEARGVAQTSDGALIVRLDEFGIAEPCLIRKRDGGFLYATTDIAGIRRRVQKLGASRAVYAVDARQSLHFRQVFAAATKAGYARMPDGADAELVHAAFGMVLGEDNRPFKTRSGDNVKLSDLLDEAVTRAEAAVAQKNPALSPDDRRAVAEAVGIGAIKYADLSSDRIKDYVFNFDRMLAFEGATGPYLQYAHVRVCSILRKALDEHGLDARAIAQGSITIGAPEEKSLALELLKYASVVRAAADACEPHRLCGHLFDLASAFARFFDACPVLRAPDDATRLSRLRLATITGRVLGDGLRCLGIAAPQRM